MTNAVLQYFITTFGNRIFCINMDNTRFIYVGYKGGTKLTDISLETIEGVDFLIVSAVDNSSGFSVPYKNYHKTADIQWIGIVDEGFEKYGIDPLILR